VGGGGKDPSKGMFQVDTNSIDRMCRNVDYSRK